MHADCIINVLYNYEYYHPGFDTVPHAGQKPNYQSLVATYTGALIERYNIHFVYQVAIVGTCLKDLRTFQSDTSGGRGA